MNEGNEGENESVVVSSFPKNDHEVICLGVSIYKGKRYVFIRAYIPGLEGDLIPTQKGINLGIEKCAELVEGVRSLGEVMSPEKVVARVKKNSLQEIWIGTSTYKGIPLIDIRTYASFDGDDFKPLKKGVSMRVELFPQLLEAVEKLTEAVVKLE